MSGGLRFCMITTFYPPYSFGGDAIGIQRLSRGLVRRGHEVTVIHDRDAFEALDRRRIPPPAPENDGVEIVSLHSSLRLLSPLLTQQLGRPVLQANRLHEILAPGRFDVVNFHNVSLVGGPGILSYGGDAVTLYMAHEHWLVCPMHVLWRHARELCTGRECTRCTFHYRRPPQLWRGTGYLERQLESVDAIIAMSEFSRGKHREFGFPRDMEVLPYFLPDPVPGTSGPAPAGDRPQERPYFFFAGRLERIKGLDDVIPVFRDFSHADLIIAGDGEHASALRRLAEGIPNVNFLGRVAPESLRRYYQHAIALIVPSECYETFGIVLIESFQQGTPVIARRLGPFPEILAQSGGGELFDTQEDLLAAMRRLQSDTAYRDRLSAAGYRSYVERWSESAVIPQYLDIVRRAAARRGHARVAASLEAQEVA